MRPFFSLPSCPAWVLLAAAAGCTAADRLPSSGAAATPAVFDVPALVGKDIDAVRAQLLGPARAGRDYQSARPGAPAEWVKSFRRDTTTLVVSYNADTRQVHDFFVKTASGAAADYRPLLALAGVPADTRQLRVEPVRTVADRRRFAGVRLVPR